MNEEILRELVVRAEVPAEKECAAREWLEFYLTEIFIPWTKVRKSRAKSLFDAAGQRGAPADHNAPLERVLKAARKLSTALVKLRRRRYSHLDFWMFEGFGPIHGGQLESAGVFRALAAIQEAAQRAKTKRAGRPPSAGDRRLIQLALKFYAEFSPRKPTPTVSTRVHGFMWFASAFYAAATGTKRDPEELLGPARTVLKDWKEKAPKIKRLSAVR